MPVRTANHSSYPRVGDGSTQQRLRRAVQDHQDGRLDESGLRDAQRAAVREAIAEQADAGIDVVTDGQIRWNDPVSHAVRRLTGVEIDGLVRFYDTNFYYRQPVISKTPSWTATTLADDFRSAQDDSPRPVKAVLTGPYTTARLSKLTAGPVADVARALAKAMAEEAAALAAAGAEWIQVDEPEILKNPKDFPLAADGLRQIAAKKGKARLIVATYFGDATPIYDLLQQLPCDVLGLDMTYGPGLWDRIAKEGTKRELQLGVVDARNTKPEDVAPLAARLKPIAAKAPVILSPSAGLEHLPRDRARRKLETLARLKKALS